MPSLPDLEHLYSAAEEMVRAAHTAYPSMTSKGLQELCERVVTIVVTEMPDERAA